MDRREFARRRREVMRMIGKDGIAVVAAAPVRHRNGDIEYAYAGQPVLLLERFPSPTPCGAGAGRPQAEYLLFVREHDPLRDPGGAGRHRRCRFALRRGRRISDRGHR